FGRNAGETLLHFSLLFFLKQDTKSTNKTRPAFAMFVEKRLNQNLKNNDRLKNAGFRVPNLTRSLKSGSKIIPLEPVSKDLLVGATRKSHKKYPVGLFVLLI
ncbi:MAG: hypothetical protein ACR2H1_13620, partial [Limisphaerales bacterium]